MLAVTFACLVLKLISVLYLRYFLALKFCESHDQNNYLRYVPEICLFLHFLVTSNFSVALVNQEQSLLVLKICKDYII